MGCGKTIVLTCECGFQTDRATVGHLLPHESSFGGLTFIEATYDPAERRIVEHSMTLPANLENRLNREPGQVIEDAANAWFDDQRRIIQTRHGQILEAPEGKQTTAFKCPECQVRKLELAAVGNWIA